MILYAIYVEKILNLQKTDSVCSDKLKRWFYLKCCEISNHEFNFCVWFNVKFTKRLFKKSTVINNVVSELETVKFGMTQGSCLGP